MRNQRRTQDPYALYDVGQAIPKRAAPLWYLSHVRGYGGLA